MSGETVEYESRATCILCDHPGDDCKLHWKPVVRLADHETQLGTFDVKVCTRCQLGFTDPYPTEATAAGLYDAKATTDFDQPDGSFVDRVKDLLAVRMVKGLARGRRIERVLDYGTGNGRFALCARRALPGARVDAVDHGAAPPPLLAQGSDAQVTYSSLPEFAKSSQTYDLILLRHVLEHTHDPVTLIAMLGQRLSPAGVLYIEVPNLDSTCGRLFGAYWKGYYVPRHIFHFTATSLAEVVKRAGLRGTIGTNEMPLMGNTVAILTGQDPARLSMKVAGMLLHPAQLLMGARHGRATCVNALCMRAPAT